MAPGELECLTGFTSVQLHKHKLFQWLLDCNNMVSHELEGKQTSVSKCISVTIITKILDKIIRKIEFKMKEMLMRVIYLLGKKNWNICTIMCSNIDLLIEANMYLWIKKYQEDHKPLSNVTPNPPTPKGTKNTHKKGRGIWDT